MSVSHYPTEMTWKEAQEKYANDELKLQELNKNRTLNEKELVLKYFKKYYRNEGQMPIQYVSNVYRIHCKKAKHYDIEVADIDMRTQVKMKRLLKKYQAELNIRVDNLYVYGLEEEEEGETYYNPNFLNKPLGNFKYTKHLKEHILFRELLYTFKHNFKKNTTEIKLFEYYQTLIPNFDKDKCSNRYYNCDRYERLQHIFKNIKTLKEYLNDEKYNNNIFIRN